MENFGKIGYWSSDARSKHINLTVWHFVCSFCLGRAYVLTQFLSIVDQFAWNLAQGTFFRDKMSSRLWRPGGGDQLVDLYVAPMDTCLIWSARSTDCIINIILVSTMQLWVLDLPCVKVELCWIGPLAVWWILLNVLRKYSAPGPAVLRCKMYHTCKVHMALAGLFNVVRTVCYRFRNILWNNNINIRY